MTILTFILSLFLSVLVAICTSILVVEKRRHYPIKSINVFLRRFVLIKLVRLINMPFKRRILSTEFKNMLKCCVCFSFWLTLFTDTIVFCIFGNYFFWPLSGFISAGISWTLFEYINAVDINNKTITVKNEKD